MTALRRGRATSVPVARTLSVEQEIPQAKIPGAGALQTRGRRLRLPAIICWMRASRHPTVWEEFDVVTHRLLRAKGGRRLSRRLSPQGALKSPGTIGELERS